MFNEDLQVYIAVISHQRPMNVGKILNLLKLQPTFFVGKGEKRYYEMAGARNVIEAGGLCESRNLALRLSLGTQCLQMSDDVTRFRALRGVNQVEEISFTKAVKELKEGMSKVGASLGGIAPTNNAFFAKTKINTKAFILGDFFISDDPTVGFDESLRLKEDYDFTLQHLKKRGVVCRCDWLMANFKHRTNSGGAVSYRTKALELESILRLKEKWGDLIGSNPRGETEIRLKL